jgi:hypothetical protein
MFGVLLCRERARACVAKWISRSPPKGKIVGSSPIVGMFCYTKPCECDIMIPVKHPSKVKSVFASPLGVIG